MAARMDVPAIPPFDAASDAISLGPQWEAWLERFHICIAAAAAITDSTQQRALLLHIFGESVQEVFEGLRH